MAEPKASKRSKVSHPSNPQNITDPRFTSLVSGSDARFRLPSKKKSHVVVDPRFSRMLQDDDFSGSAKVDRYGRKLSNKSGRKQLERFYRLEEESARPGANSKRKRVEVSESEESDAQDAVQQKEEESDSETESDESESEEEEEVFGALQQQEQQEGGIPKGEVSRRLAVVNLDWDHIRAADLMVVLGSFSSGGEGKVERVEIFPSEFGKERMRREEMEGPPKELFQEKEREQEEPPGLSEGEESEDEDEDDEDEEEEEEKIKSDLLKEDKGVEFNSAKLRRYQLERLRYYYAVVTCSSTGLAQKIYDTVDGTEFLTTANFFDLRFIPDDTDFSDDKTRDSCDRVPDGYRPTEFVTDALQHSKVRLTWDADDTERKEAQKRAFKGGRKEIDENDLKAYIGSESSDEGEDLPEAEVVDATNAVPEDEAVPTAKQVETGPKLSKKERERQKMRSLLGLPDEPVSKKTKDEPPESDLQVTFTAALTDGKDGNIFENTPEQAQETTVEKYVRKERERKARRKDKAKAKRKGDDAVQSNGEKENGDVAADVQTEDLGFDDPFFADTGTVAEKPAKKKDKKSKKRRDSDEDGSAVPVESEFQDIPPAGANRKKKRERSKPVEDDEEHITRVNNTLNEKNGDDDDHEDEEENHFNSKLLLRAEKLASKPAKSMKKKSKHLSQRDLAALEAAERDNFEMDVKDERFRDLFEKPEFAVDPTHPKYTGTAGMRKVLEEGRGRKEQVGVEEEVGVEKRRGIEQEREKLKRKKKDKKFGKKGKR